MANAQKYTRAAVGHLGKHYERGINENWELVKFGNQDIKPELSHLNYNLAPKRELNQVDFINQRISEVQCLNRKDVNVMCSWVVTLPKSLSVDREREFFEQTYDFLKNRYGGDQNVISSYIHKDENQPHMHFAFIPVIFDNKKNIEKVSAKEVINKKDLQTFHKDLSKHLELYFGYDIGILNEATKEGNKSIEELKARTAQKKLNQIHSKAKELMESTKKLENFSKIREENLNEAFEKKKSELEIKLGFLRSQLDGTELTIEKMKEIQPEKTFTGAIKGVSLDEIVNLKKTAILGVKTLEENKELLRENQLLKNKIVELQKKVPNLIQLTEQATDKSRLLELERLFEKIPQSIKKELFQTKKNTKTFDFER